MVVDCFLYGCSYVVFGVEYVLVVVGKMVVFWIEVGECGYYWGIVGVIDVLCFWY